MSSDAFELYRHDHFLAKRQMFKLLGAAFWLQTLDGRTLAYSKQKAFRLKEDIRVYANEEQTEEILHIQADRIVDFSAAYKVVDSREGEVVGTVRRKGWSSLFRDSWELLDAYGNVRGQIIEDSPWKAMLRRTVELLALVLPQTYMIQVDGQTVATMQQNFLGFPPKYTVDLSHDIDGRLPRPLAIAAVILLLAIEGRQK